MNSTVGETLFASRDDGEAKLVGRGGRNAGLPFGLKTGLCSLSGLEDEGSESCISRRLDGLERRGTYLQQGCVLQTLAEGPSDVSKE